MLDSEYFRSGLQRDVDAIGGKAVVELHLNSGRSQRLRSVLAVEAGYVTVEAFRNKGGETAPPQWNEPPRELGTPHETERTVVAYEAIASVHVTAAEREKSARVGFGAAAG